jgi:hypothetical protein
MHQAEVMRKKSRRFVRVSGTRSYPASHFKEWYRTAGADAHTEEEIMRRDFTA